MKKSFWKYVELWASSLAGLLILSVPFWPDFLKTVAEQLIKSKDIRNATGLVITALGIFVFLSREAHEKVVTQLMTVVEPLAKKFDLHQTLGTEITSKIYRNQNEVKHNQLIRVRDSLLDELNRKLVDLKSGIATLSGTKYGQLQTLEINATQDGEIWALATVAHDLPGNPYSSEQTNFEEACVAAAGRGVKFTRYYLLNEHMNELEYANLVDIPFVRQHTSNSKPIGKIIFLDQIQSSDPNLYNRLCDGKGFVYIKRTIDPVLFRDSKHASSQIRGELVISQKEFEDTEQFTTDLSTHAYDLNLLHHPVTKSNIITNDVDWKDRYQQIKKSISSLERRHKVEMGDAIKGELKLHNSIQYYEWLTEKLIGDQKANIITVISTRPLSVFYNDANEKKFLENNTSAICNGTTIRRIFLINPCELVDSKNRNALTHLMSASTFNGFLWSVDHESVYKDLKGGGCSIYDSTSVFFDETFFIEINFDKNSELDSEKRRVIREATATVYFGNHLRIKQYLSKYSELEAKVKMLHTDTIEGVIKSWNQWKSQSAIHNSFSNWEK